MRRSTNASYILARMFRPFCSVQLIALREGLVLLSMRANTGFEDGNYGLVSGHIEGDEATRAAMVREAREEAGIQIDPAHLRLVHTMHRRSPDREYIDLFFEASSWLGEPDNREPGKCDELAWFQPDDLPANTIEYVREAIVRSRAGASFSEFGFA